MEAFACKHNFYFFLRSFWDVVVTEDPVFNWHIEYLCDELQIVSEWIVKRQPKLYDLIINVPPGSTKSTICTIMFPAWLAALDPSLTAITNSYSSDLSIEHAIKSRDIIQSPKFKRLFPNTVIRKDKGGKEHYEYTAKGARVTTSTGSAITGFHGNVIISDDPVNPNEALSDVKRVTANEHTKTLASRKRDKKNTPTILVMQRLHEEDVTGYLLKKHGKTIKHICLPAEVSDKVSPPELKEKYIDGLLDPIRINNEVIEEFRLILGSDGYAKQFEQAPTSAAGNIIKKEWFQIIDKVTFDGLIIDEPSNFFLDTAFSKKDKKTDNDPSGIIATKFIRNNLYIYKAKKEHKDAPELLRFIDGWTKENGYNESSIIRIEPKANGKAIVQMLLAGTKLNVVESHPPTDDKETRLRAYAPKVECGRVYLVQDSWTDDFIEEVCGFPFKSHDEYVDCLSEALRHTFVNEADNYENIANYLGL